MSTLAKLRAAIAAKRTTAALVPGLPALLSTIEEHLVDTELRIARLEAVNRSALASLAAAKSIAGGADRG